MGVCNEPTDDCGVTVVRGAGRDFPLDLVGWVFGDGGSDGAILIQGVGWQGGVGQPEDRWLRDAAFVLLLVTYSSSGRHSSGWNSGFWKCAVLKCELRHC